MPKKKGVLSRVKILSAYTLTSLLYPPFPICLFPSALSPEMNSFEMNYWIFGHPFASLSSDQSGLLSHSSVTLRQGCETDCDMEEPMVMMKWSNEGKESC